MQKEILLVIVRNCAKHQYEKNTISLISEQIKVSRNKAAMAINELVETGHLIRVNSKPYIYLATSYLRNKGIEVTSASYSSLDDVWALANEEKKDFASAIGICIDNSDARRNLSTGNPYCRCPVNITRSKSSGYHR